MLLAIHDERSSISKTVATIGIFSMPEALSASSAARAGWSDLQPASCRLGYEQAEGFASPHGLISNEPGDCAEPAIVELDHWALTGAWTLLRRSIVLHAAYGRIVYRFRARRLYLAMQPRPRSRSSQFRVLLDDEIPAAARGADVDSQGYGIVDRPKTYELVNQSTQASYRTLQIQFLDRGIEAHSFFSGETAAQHRA
jgi:hypothetical protein